MRQQKFIDSLHDAGWQAVNDAQWDNIGKLWRELFPVVAELEDELDETYEALAVEVSKNTE